MRIYAILLLVLAGTSVLAKTYLISPSGLASNTGQSFNSAYDISTALSKAAAGDSLILQAGTYTRAFTSGAKNTLICSKSGSATAPIYIGTVGQGRAIFDFSYPLQEWIQDGWGFDVSGSYWYFKNISITRAGYQGAYVKGSYNTFDNCAFYENRNTGLEINKGGAYTTVINCDAYKNYDPKKKGSMADGFGPKETQGPGNKFISCRSWNNSDDGYDTFNSAEAVTFEYCWAFNNGVDIWNYGGFTGNGNGFKVGGNFQLQKNKLHHCVSFGNPLKGFDQNNNTGGLVLYNCTGYNNGTNFGMGNDVASGEKHDLKNNISLGAAANISNAVQSNNSWNSGFSVSTADFVSLDLSKATLSRNADGSLPVTELFRLKTSSLLIDAGINVGLPYNGSKPDLGAFETGVVTEWSDHAIAEQTLIYPNPSNTNFLIQSVDTQTYGVYNAQGLWLENIAPYTLFGDTYPSGVYLLKKAGYAQTYKIVKY